MIMINDPIFGKECSCCFTRKDVKEITFHDGGHGTIVRLCSNCRKELMNKLKDPEGSRRADAAWEVEHTDWDNESRNG